MYFLFKTLVTALIIAGVSEIARRYTVMAGVIAALPLTSLLTFLWIYHDTHDTQKISELSHSIIWLSVPSFAFFIALTLLLNYGTKFYPALLLSTIIMLLGNWLVLYVRSVI